MRATLHHQHAVIIALCLAAFLSGCNARTRSWIALRPTADPNVMLSTAVAPGEVHVMVVDASSGKPLEDAQVVVSGTTIGAKTDRTGMARLRIEKAGRVELRVLYIGFKAWRGNLDTSPTAGTVLVLQLERQPIMLHEDSFRE